MNAVAEQRVVDTQSQPLTRTKRRAAIRRHLPEIRVRPPTLLAPIVGESVVGAAGGATGHGTEGVEEPEGSAAHIRGECWFRVWCAAADDVVDHAAKLGPEGERPSAPDHLDAVERLRRWRVIRFRVAVEVGGDVHTILPGVHLRRLRRVESPESHPIRWKSRTRGFGKLRAGHSTEDLAFDVLGQICVEAVERHHFSFLSDINDVVPDIGKMADHVQRSGGGHDQRCQHDGRRSQIDYDFGRCPGLNREAAPQWRLTRRGHHEDVGGSRDGGEDKASGAVCRGVEGGTIQTNREPGNIAGCLAVVGDAAAQRPTPAGLRAGDLARDPSDPKENV